MASGRYWNTRYQTIGPTAVSWFEAVPQTSLDLIDAVGVTPTDPLIDVGGGASSLVDHLLTRGHRDVTVLDASAVALASARDRVGDRTGSASWIEADLLTWKPTRLWAAWHDRAVLHFLVEDDARAAYVDRLRRAVEPAGAFVIGVFAEDGPQECSGLPVRPSSPADLRDLLTPATIVAERRSEHRTPAGALQPFNWIAGRTHARADSPARGSHGRGQPERRRGVGR